MARLAGAACGPSIDRRTRHRAVELNSLTGTPTRATLGAAVSRLDAAGAARWGGRGAMARSRLDGAATARISRAAA
jgi:hypothetical protein